MKITGKLIMHPTLKCLGYYKNGKFVKILTREEYEEMKTIKKGGEKK